MYLILIVYDFSMTISVYFQDRNISFWGSSSSRCISLCFPSGNVHHLEHGKKCPFKMKFDELSIRNDDFP